jgi:hypothetical protein
MKRLVCAAAVLGIATFGLTACGVPVATTPSPNSCKVTVHAPKHSNFDVYGAGELSCLYQGDTLHIQTQILFWTFWGWRTLGIVDRTVNRSSYTSTTAAWPCKSWSPSDRHEFKTSVTSWEALNGLRYHQIPDPKESGSAYLNCDPAEGW